jgi:hypothetical protein
MRPANPRGQTGPPLRPPTVIANIATHAMNLSPPVWMRRGGTTDCGGLDKCAALW